MPGPGMATTSYDIYGNPLGSPSIPVAGLATTIATGGTAVTVFNASTIQNGFYIQNPSTATEVLFVDLTGATAVAGSGTAIGLVAGAALQLEQPVVTKVTAVAATSAHAFVAVRY